jgi:hypothetical protein
MVVGWIDNVLRDDSCLVAPGIHVVEGFAIVVKEKQIHRLHRLSF